MLPRRLLALVRSPGANGSHGTGRLASWTVPIGPAGPGPIDLLARAPGQPRGFWEHEDTWCTHVGHAAVIEVRQDVPVHGPGSTHARGATVLPADGDEDRFTAVRRAAARLAAAAVADGEDGAARPVRFHGGFSFHEDHRPGGPWAAFPSARFTVPALELEGGPAGVRLTATVLVERGTGKRDVLRAARDEAERGLSALESEAAGRATEHPLYALTDKTGIDVWDAAVAGALDRIDRKQLSKVVLARAMSFSLAARPDPVVVLSNLRGDNPGTNVFLIEPRPGAAFLGASPERIGAVRGSVLHASAVAGSAPRGATPEEDDRLSQAMVANRKDRDEHDIVVESMRRRLTAVADHVEMAGDTHVLRLTRIQHLETDLYARLTPGTHVLDAVRALHPTPAVCGSPRETAMDFLREAEPFERGWYAGPVGWFDAGGDGEFAPGLRSAVLEDHTWHLYAGAGIVAGSVSAREWDETAIKFEPVLRALGVGEAP